MVRADVPRARRAAGPPPSGSKRKRRGIWRKIFLTLFSLTVLGVALVVGGLAYAYAHTEIPQPKADISAQVSIVYWADGTSELGRFAEVNRQIVPASAIKKNVRDAVVAAEDRTFYTNRGISVTGIARAAWNDVRGKPLQGGSTITQQYVKNSYLTSERTLKRKLEEFLVSVKISRAQNKDDILTNYLNTVYFGRNTYGVEAASRSYFGKSVSALDDSQAAFLAGILNSPENYDPLDGAASAARAQTRWNYVLDGMVEMGTLPAAERASLTFPRVLAPQTRNTNAGQVGYLLQMVRQEIKTKLGYTETQIDTGGLRITSTFDKRDVEAGAAAVKKVMPKRVPAGVQITMASVDPATGAVKAIYGGPDYLVRQRNAATQDVAQAGSTFKPFALVAALGGTSGNGSDGISLDSRFDGNSPQRFPGYSVPVRNEGNQSYGTISLLRATEDSVNTVYLNVNEKIGPKRTYRAALAAGLPKSTLDLGPNMSNVLGAASVHAVDMATAYSTFAAGGAHHDRYVVSRVVGPNGGEIYKVTPAGKQVFDKRVVSDVNYALQQVVRSGTGTYAQRLGRPAAGKTGTTNDNKSAWFDGYTPQLVTVVGIYRVSSDGTKALPLPGFGGFSSIHGNTFPIRIWTAYMASALKGQPVRSFPPRSDVGRTLNAAPTPTATPTTSRTSTQATLTPTPSATRTQPGPTPTTTPTRTRKPTPRPTGRPTKTRTRKPLPTPGPPSP